MRTALMACLLFFSASVAHADTPPNRGAPYSGFSDEFYYSGGRMTGGQSVYKNLPQTAEPPKTQERKHGSHAIPEYHYSTGYANRNVIWNVPNSTGFLSPCQAQVQAEINAHTGDSYEINFTGSPTYGQAFDRQGKRYDYSCNGAAINIW